MTTEATIRHATADDAPALAAFNREMALETENLSLRPEVIIEGVKAVFDDPARGFYLVAEAHGPEARGRLVASLLVTTEWSDWRNAQLWWIQSVYVTPKWRRRGLYRALYHRVKQLAEREPVCGFRLYVERDNHAAQQTYAALGMRETHYKVFEQLNPAHEFTR